MHAVTDYMFSLSGGLLNRGYNIEACVNFLMEQKTLELDKLLHRYNHQLVRDIIQYLVSRLLFWSCSVGNELTLLLWSSVQQSTRCKPSRIIWTPRFAKFSSLNFSNG